jgi:hypothetical protein
MTYELPTQASKAILPPRLVVYGPEKIGKSNFGASIPDAIYLDVEGGSGALSVARIEKERLETLADFMAALDALLTQDHNFSAAVIDTADWLETLVCKQIAAESGKKSIEDIPYRAGHNKLPDAWKQIFAKLDQLREKRGMVIVFLAHCISKRYDDPLTDSYMRHQLKLYEGSASVLAEWADCILFANEETFIDKTEVGFKKVVKRGKAGERSLHTEGQPGFIAGNRYGLPEVLPLVENQGWAVFIEAFNQAVSA